jgi:NAD(P)-dependent dehydrogenase (short-subunit alcohol dehydrogenase family)
VSETGRTTRPPAEAAYSPVRTTGRFRLRLDERVVFVTGGASGMGRAASLRCAQAGGRIAVVDLDPAGAEAVAESIVSEGGEALAVQADVTLEPEVEAAVAAVSERFGGIDVLLACAGVNGPFAKVTDVELEDWERVMAVNVRGVFLAAKHCIRSMRDRGGGTVVIIASDSAYVASPTMSAYCSSKGAVLMLTRALAVDHADEGIRVNCVCPSVVDTPMSRAALGAGDRDLAEFGVPRAHTPESIAEKLLFLASDASAGISGASLVVDFGGLATSTFPV